MSTFASLFSYLLKKTAITDVSMSGDGRYTRWRMERFGDDVEESADIEFFDHAPQLITYRRAKMQIRLTRGE